MNIMKSILTQSIRYFIIYTIFSLILINTLSCTQENEIPELSISLWVYDESNKPVFKKLYLNEVKKVYPPGESMDLVGINITFEFNGLIKLETKEYDIQMMWGETTNNHSVITNNKNTQHGYEYISANTAVISANIVGVTPATGQIYTYQGKEYFINVTTFSLSNETRPIIKAQLKLVQLDSNTVYSKNYSIELIYYEYIE